MEFYGFLGVPWACPWNMKQKLCQIDWNLFLSIKERDYHRFVTVSVAYSMAYSKILITCHFKKPWACLGICNRNCDKSMAISSFHESPSVRMILPRQDCSPLVNNNGDKWDLVRHSIVS